MPRRAPALLAILLVGPASPTRRSRRPLAHPLHFPGHLEVTMLARTSVLLAMFLVGCPASNDDHMNPNRVARVVTSADGDIGVVVDGHNAFSWDLYGDLAAEAGDGNVFFSPFSVTAALGMVMAGANGDTETEMHDVLHVTGDEGAWHAALGALTRDLNGDLDRGYTLNIANRVFGQTDYGWDPAFLAVCDTDYGAPLEQWDFATDAKGGRTHVNDWVAGQTHDRIKDLLGEGTVTPDTKMILVNAIYFLADWATAFDPADTYDAGFTRLDGSSVTVPMMRMSLEEVEDEGIEVGWTNDASVIKLPYQDDEVSMIVVIPTEPDGLPALESSLDAAKWAQLTSNLSPSDAMIGFPRVEMNYKAELSGALSGLGMPTAFSDTADFTGMAADGGLQITGVVHQAFVKIDEEGTEAAAATAVTVGTTSAQVPIVADHPFLFVIQDDLTGAILFVGRVTDPS